MPAANIMNTVPIRKFIQKLCSIPETEFSVGNIYDFLKNHSADMDSLKPFLFFSKKKYTRNLIYKNDLFELIALCWESGQSSSVHNHYDQNCWMTVAQGKLRIQDFRVLELDESSGYCRIEPAESYNIDNLSPCEVNPDEPIHQVLNLAEFGEKAISLHIYSKPFDRCLVYTPQNSKYREIQLSYSSEYGKLCEGVEL